jgi:hypothetical protein
MIYYQAVITEDAEIIGNCSHKHRTPELALRCAARNATDIIREVIE